MLTSSQVTVILNVWRRNYIEEQIEALLSQSVTPQKIWLLQQCNHISVEKIIKKYHPMVDYFYSSIDLKYFCRFSIAHLVNTKYLWILDDDVIPSKGWIELCLQMIEEKNSIISPNGRILPKGDLTPELPKHKDYLTTYFIGDGHNRPQTTLCENDTVVDFGCTSFFMKTEWLKYFWNIQPFTFETGEDIHLSASCKLLGNIATIVPKQQAVTTGNLKCTYSYDMFASWKKNDFLTRRTEIFKYLITQHRWQPILWPK
ncbi:glycosyltransferase family A protein [Xanthocytophaga agilis]|uniref:Glycosyltransferase family A protein n=1 Tax=Xanthocytophaga agilis TaxID=3048010 RepID=A0AAE3R8F2_9BACT|nr:glycosyltransferase family A protein [Xanthocytophaga agilis]MDJ1505766.1 glycosyltransferase family A protein [Xanthocytophaga agilis]